MQRTDFEHAVTGESLPTIEQRLTQGRFRVGVVGLGYVGLPLAVAFAEAGLPVLGFDVQARRVEAVRSGRSYIGDVEGARLQAVVEARSLEATVDEERLGEPDAVCICVPTPLTRTKEPDLSAVVRVSEELAKRLRPGQLVILESTTYPGTTEEVVLPTLTRSGLKPGKEFFLAYSPERVDPGNRTYTIRNTPKIVGGIDETSTRLAIALYRQVADHVVVVRSPRVAEMAKVFENVFRAVNIALVNEAAQLCEKMGVSVWDVLAAAATKPFGFVPFRPGPGVGGHCIPLDPYYLASKAREYDFHTRFIELAGEINETMPTYVARRIADALNDRARSLRGTRVLLLGVAYKRDVGDVRESPALKLLRLLRASGAEVAYHDPHVPEVEERGRRIRSIPLALEELGAWDCVVIAVDHSALDYRAIAARASLVFDACGATAALGDRDNIVRL